MRETGEARLLQELRKRASELDEFPLDAYQDTAALLREAAAVLASRALGEEPQREPVHVSFERDEDGDIIARFLGFPNASLTTHGATYAEALFRLSEVVRLYNTDVGAGPPLPGDETAPEKAEDLPGTTRLPECDGCP